MDTIRKSGPALTIVAGLLFSAALPLQAEDMDRCRRRIVHEEHELHRAGVEVVGVQTDVAQSSTGIGQSLRDVLSAFLEDGQDPLISKLIKHHRHNDKADALGAEMRPIHPEGFGDVLDGVGDTASPDRGRTCASQPAGSTSATPQAIAARAPGASSTS